GRLIVGCLGWTGATHGVLAAYGGAVRAGVCAQRRRRLPAPHDRGHGGRGAGRRRGGEAGLAGRLRRVRGPQLAALTHGARIRISPGVSTGRWARDRTGVRLTCPQPERLSTGSRRTRIV